MENFIEACPVHCIKAIGYSLAHRTCNNAKKSFSITNNLLAIYITLKCHVFKIPSCYSRVLSFFILLLLITPAIKAQQDLSYTVHANIIYRFTKYIDWPNYNNSGDFVIGIVGDTPLYGELEDFSANKTVGNRKIVIKKMSSSANSYNCHILFISEDKSKSLKKIAEITKGSPILIVSEAGPHALKGSCINFVIVNERLKLEINKTNIEDRNLNIASELLRLGTIIK